MSKTASWSSLRPIRVAVLFAGIAPLTSAANADELSPLWSAFGEAKPIVDTRLRYETVEQTPFADRANSLTLRARLGFETGKAWSTTLLVEGEAVVPLDGAYNSTTNGKTAYPIVADPEAYELNRLQLVNTALPDTTITLGRQRIALDDHRFIGNVSWRQNEQTFDALRVVNTSVANVTADVAYIDQVNRIFGPDGKPGANVGRFHGDSFIGNLAWQTPYGKLTGFAYLLDFQETPQPLRDSSQTYGLRFAGEKALSSVHIAYVFSGATQRPYGDNPLHFSNDYLLAELTGSYRNYSLGAGYERLEGDGVKGFTTPLATLHRFQGWADKFLVTPVNGILDTYVNAGYRTKGLGPLDMFSIALSWHTYESQRLSIDYGSELDFQVQAKIHRYVALVKLADYRAAATTPLTLRDTTKVIAQIEYAW
jgi:hypothetical protein